MSEDTKLILMKLDGIDGRLERVEKDVAVLKEDVAVLKEDVAVLKEDVAVLKKEVEVLKENVTVLNGRTNIIQLDVVRHQLETENEIKPNIQLIAEGYVMLNEKLDRIVSYEYEREIMRARVDALEAGFRMIKDKIDKTA